ncbi:unnamed protein product [Ixodes pacificus]
MPGWHGRYVGTALHCLWKGLRIIKAQTRQIFSASHWFPSAFKRRFLFILSQTRFVIHPFDTFCACCAFILRAAVKSHISHGVTMKALFSVVSAKSSGLFFFFCILRLIGYCIDDLWD